MWLRSPLHACCHSNQTQKPDFNHAAGAPEVESAHCYRGHTGDAFSNPLPECRMVERALEFATVRLSGRTRGKHDEPSVLHSIRVAIIVHREFHIRACRSVVIALLHDVLEDSDTDYDEIAQEFGEEVADAVVLLTKPKFYPKPLRKKIYESGLLIASEEVLLVKLADYYENLQSRRGCKRLRRTWKAVRGFICGIDGRHHGPKLRRAIRILKNLLCELERGEAVLADIEHEHGHSDDVRVAA